MFSIGKSGIARRFFKRVAKAIVKENVCTKKAEEYLEESGGVLE